LGLIDQQNICVELIYLNKYKMFSLNLINGGIIFIYSGIKSSTNTCYELVKDVCYFNYILYDMGLIFVVVYLQFTIYNNTDVELQCNSFYIKDF